jgi:thiosulfate/3-mercaptopyruvate sulfurtransferase
MTYKDFVNPNLVWTPKQLRDRIGDRMGDDLVIIDTRPAPDFCAGHIEGAAHFDLYGLSLNDTRPEPLAAFIWTVAYLMEIRGVEYNKTVIFYEQNTGVRATRGFWFLEYLGHEDVHVLDGGITAWKGAGLPVTREAWPMYGSAPDIKPKGGSRIARTGFSKHLKRPVEERLATAQYLFDHLRDPDVKIHDARSDAEYYAEHVRAARGGTVPGSVHLEWLHFLGPDGALKPAAELREMLEGRGLTSDKEIVPFCHGGYRSAHAYLVYRLLDYPRARNYLGSWKEWGDRTDLPIEVPTR